MILGALPSIIRPMLASSNYLLALRPALPLYIALLADVVATQHAVKHLLVLWGHWRCRDGERPSLYDGMNLLDCCSKQNSEVVHVIRRQVSATQSMVKMLRV